MPGSTKKTCLSCKLQINVGCKSCKLCGASQPQKIKLESAKNKISKEWAQKILNGRNTSKLINSANLLLHKFHVLGYYPLLLLGKRKAGKTSNFGAEVLCTRQFSSQMEKTTISTIRLLYEGLLKGISSGAPEVNPSSFGAPEVNPSSSCAPEVNHSSSGAPEVNPSSSCAPEVNPSSSCAPEVNPSSSCAPEVNPSSSCAPEVNPSSSCAPEVNPSSSCAPEVNPSSSGAPEVNPSSSGAPEVNPSSSCAPEVNPSSSGAPEVNPSSSGAPEVNPSSSGTNKFSSRKRTQKILSKGKILS
ncbi:hypothetical protein AMEX_G26359 [Astyanax mexicanus]|uniref:Uncharacterized protein n=1 Tax=Astyanax mexicanus TaxID=7994 RepID=A0A8T2KQB5_ASTMX|nr:hypothetical protein AMEX_G26359 [Astyanax mexicanus]